MKLLKQVSSLYVFYYYYYHRVFKTAVSQQPTKTSVSLRDDLVFLFLQLIDVIGIIQDQRTGRRTVYYFFPIELW